ncbi:MAG: adenylosuccinate lyase, partial [Clostridia bacterium]|nr:adenylosuccinate lyase [Clostridia bacterium]
MTDNSVYVNPLITRYASREMSEAFSDEKRFKLWRKLWIALAESEMELGLNITKEQVDEMKKYAESINFELAEQYERGVRH